MPLFEWMMLDYDTFSDLHCVGECSQIKPFYVSTEQLSAVVNHIPDRKFGGKTLFGAFSINELIIKVDEFGRTAAVITLQFCALPSLHH